eukprot:TRINITY_DN24130_c0_g1_i1.p1 TRINITY_DN24130_c0_g1~~TRINITY_DN24130_c0_g1_i1.p1  ORF type:complete len:325 (+),score=45.27 TRINITY_DN24130_c0_g1_i1:124-1098(+)
MYTQRSMTFASEYAVMQKLKRKREEFPNPDVICRVVAFFLFVCLCSVPAQVYLTGKKFDWARVFGSCINPAHPTPTVSGSALAAVRADLGYAKLLVFEAGTDAPLWAAWNCKGRTLLLEPHEVPDSTLKNELPYSATGDVNETELLRSFRERVPHEARSVAWNQIVVSATAASPHLNIFAASRLAGPDTVVFVADCQSPMQKAYVQRWLGHSSFSTYDDGHGGSVCRLVGTTEVSSNYSAASAKQGRSPLIRSARDTPLAVAAAGSAEVFPASGISTEEKAPSEPLRVVCVAGVLIVYAVVMCQSRMHVMETTGGLKRVRLPRN